jgi:TetR/AcrR family transcriptional regulator, regulator of cefoperazone and chloramphenicol sensitivity
MSKTNRSSKAAQKRSKFVNASPLPITEKKKLRTSSDEIQVGTRERLLETALHEFGTHGFDGVTARRLSTAANVPLSAIPYHFGTMQNLYRATIVRVTELIAARLGPAVDFAQQQALSCKGNQAKSIVENLLAEMLRVLVVSEESNAWAKVMMRELQSPSIVVDGMENDVMFRAHRTICALIARANRVDAGASIVALQAFALMGQVMIFRHIQPIVRLRMGWPQMGDAELALLKAAIRVQL